MYPSLRGQPLCQRRFSIALKSVMEGHLLAEPEHIFRGACPRSFGVFKGTFDEGGSAYYRAG